VAVPAVPPDGPEAIARRRLRRRRPHRHDSRRAWSSTRRQAADGNLGQRSLHCGASLSGTRVMRPGIVHRLDKDERPIGGRQDHRVAAFGAVRRSQAHGTAGAQLSCACLGSANSSRAPSVGTRPLAATARRWRSSPRAQAGAITHFPGEQALRSPPKTGCRRPPPIAGWKPAAPIRSGCTWLPSVIPLIGDHLQDRLRHQGDPPASAGAQLAEAFPRQALHAWLLNLSIRRPGWRCASSGRRQPTWGAFGENLAAVKLL
jgi:hypothetical protein